MKILVEILFGLAVLCSLVLSFTGCKLIDKIKEEKQNGDGEHEHTYTDNVCECGVLKQAKDLNILCMMKGNTTQFQESELAKIRAF